MIFINTVRTFFIALQAENTAFTCSSKILFNNLKRTMKKDYSSSTALLTSCCRIFGMQMMARYQCELHVHDELYFSGRKIVQTLREWERQETPSQRYSRLSPISSVLKNRHSADRKYSTMRMRELSAKILFSSIARLYWRSRYWRSEISRIALTRTSSNWNSGEYKNASDNKIAHIVEKPQICVDDGIIDVLFPIQASKIVLGQLNVELLSACQSNPKIYDFKKMTSISCHHWKTLLSFRDHLPFPNHRAQSQYVHLEWQPRHLLPP